MSKKNKERPAQISLPLKSVSPPDTERYLVYFLLLLALAFVLIVRGRLLGLPLERDEGEYAYMGQLILDGIPPYKEAFNMKLPGTYYMYALFMGVFGQSIVGIHLGLLIINVISIALLYFIGKKIVNPIVGAIAGLSYAILSVTPGTYGLAAHATHFNVLFGLGGFLSLLYALENQKWKWTVASGLLFGLSFVMKQQAVFLVLFGGIVLLVDGLKRSPRDLKNLSSILVVFAIGVALPYLVVVLVALSTGSFDQFWHWTMDYARQYVGIKTWGEASSQLVASMNFVTTGSWWLWMMGLAGLVALYFIALSSRNRLIIMLFAVFSFLCMCPGFYFRNHYFIVFLPVLSLLIGVAVQFMMKRATKLEAPTARYLPLAVFGLFVVLSLYPHKKLYFTYPVAEVCARLYGSNPFAETLEVAKFIRENTADSDRVAVIGSEPQVYFYSKRKSATGFLYVYPLMENQPYSMEMQQHMIADIERHRPKYLVFVDSPFSWLVRQNSDQSILDWFENYSTAHYNMVGFADMVGPGKTKYVWREALPYYRVQGQASVSVFERKN